MRALNPPLPKSIYLSKTPLMVDFAFLQKVLNFRWLQLPNTGRQFVRKISAVRFPVPKYFGSKAVLGLFTATAIYSFVLGGYAHALADYTTSLLGLKVDAVRISGQRQVDESDVLKALGLGPYASLALLDVEKARANLQAMAWIDEVSIRKTYPGQVEIDIKEHEPFALWQSGQLVSVIDKNGRIISGLKDAKIGSLIVLVGDRAEVAGPDFMETLDEFSQVKSEVRAAVLVAGRRWNLILHNGIEVKLPENDVKTALNHLANKFELFEKDVVSIDMRLPGQMAVRLSKTAMTKRQEAFEERVKELKRGAI